MSRKDSQSDAASSVGDQSDAGSEKGGSGGGSQGDAAEFLKETKFSFKAAVFGVVYEMRRLPLDRDFRLGIPTMFLEFLQWLILIFGPEWDWDVNWANSWWRFYSRWQLQRAIAERSHLVFMVVFYLMTAFILGILGGSVYLYFMHKSRKKLKWQWPLTAFRILVFLFFVTFQTSFLLIFTVPWTCPVIGKRVNKQLSYFPGQYCLKGANLIHAAVGIVMSLLFAILSITWSLADGSDLDPHSKSYYASPCGKWTLRRAIVKSLLPLLAAALPNYVHMRAWLYFGALVYNYWIQMRHVPYYHTWVNCLFAFCNCTFAWGSFLLLIGTYMRAHWSALTDAFYAGVVLSLLSVFLTGLRLKFIRFFAERMSGWTAELTPSQQHHFRDAFEVELCARVCRKTVLDETLLIRVPHPNAVALAETMFKAGIHQYPKSEYLLIMQTGYRMSLKNDQPGPALAKARVMTPSITEQYQIFAMDQGEADRMAQENADNTMDMASYAEFQRQFKALKEAHKQTLFNIRSFWQLLTRHEVKYTSLVNSFAKMRHSQDLAERAYKQGLLMYPKQPALLRSYAQFMQDIKLNPNASMRYYSEADKMDAQLSESRKDAMMTRIDAAAMDSETMQMLSMINEEKDCNIVINAEGIIQFANKGLTYVFGWSPQDVEGKNVSMLMPPPFSQMHNSFLRSYVDSGVANILNTTREVQGLHMDRYSFPIKIAVTKVPQSGGDGFMSVIKPLSDDIGIAMVYVTPAGIIVSLGRGFSNLFGHNIAEFIGKPLQGICKDPEMFNKLLSAAVASEAESIDDSGTLSIMHKYGDEIPVHIKYRKAGRGAAKIIMLTMVPLDNHICVVAISLHAKILYANDSTAALLGYKAAAEISGKLTLPQLMTVPCQQLHQNFFKGHDTSKVAGLSCRSGRVVLAGDKNYNPVPITMVLRQHDDEVRGKVWTARIAKATPEQQIAWHTMHVVIDSFGMIQKGRADPALFGVKTEELIGQSVAFCIDHFRHMIETGGSMVDGIKQFVAEAKTSKQQVWRVGVCPKGRRTVPALMKVQFLEDDKTGLLLFHAENIDGVIELDNGCVIKAVRETAALMFGVSVASMVGCDLSRFLPNACPSKNATDMLIVGDSTAKKGGMGSKSKKTVGKLMPLEAKHADGSTLAMVGQAAQHPDKPRVMIRLRLFKPTSPRERTASMAAAMSREAKLLPGVLPIQDTPTGVPANPGRPLIDFTSEVPPPVVLAVPAGGAGGIGSKQPSTVKQDLEASDRMLAAMDRAAYKGSVISQGSAALPVPPVKLESQPGEDASGTAGGLPAAATDPDMLAEVMPLTARDLQLEVPAVTTTAPGAPSEVTPGVLSSATHSPRGSELDIELGSHHGSQQGSAAVSSHEGEQVGEVDEDEAAAAADFTPMTEEKRIFVNEWIAKLGTEAPEEDDEQKLGEFDRAANDAAARVAGVGGDREDRALLAAAAEEDEGDGGAVTGLDSASAAGDNPEGGDTMNAADFARAKRYKKVTAKLNTGQVKAKSDRWRKHAQYVLLFLITVHTAAFIASRVLTNTQKNYISLVTQAGVCTREVSNLGSQAREMQLSGSMYGGNGTSTPVTIRSQSAIAAAMLTRLDVLQAAQQELYLKLGSLGGNVRVQMSDLFSGSSINTTVYQSATSDSYVETGLWNAGNSLIAASRAVAALPATFRYNFEYFPQWHYIVDNVKAVFLGFEMALDLQTAAAQTNASLLEKVDIIMLVVEGAVLIPVALIYLTYLRVTVARDRVKLYSIFLRIPRPFVVVQAKAEVKLVGEGNDEDDEDPGANADQQEEEEGRWAATKGMQYTARGRKLSYSNKAILQMMAPLVGWMALVILAFGLSDMFLNDMTPRLDAVNGNARIQAYTFAVKFQAGEMVLSNDSILLETSRIGVIVVATVLRYWHEKVLYGGTTAVGYYDTLHYTPHASAAYMSTSGIEQIYYSDGCLRHDKSTCFNSTSIFYPMANHGLNLYTYYYLDQADRLANDSLADVNANNFRFQFIWTAASNGLADAELDVQTEYQSYSFVPVNEAQVLQLVIFILMFFGAMAFYLWFLKPLFRLLDRERKTAAHILSQLPANIDLNQLLQPEAGVIAPKKAKKGIAPAPTVSNEGFKKVRID